MLVDVWRILLLLILMTELTSLTDGGLSLPTPSSAHSFTVGLRYNQQDLLNELEVHGHIISMILLISM